MDLTFSALMTIAVKCFVSIRECKGTVKNNVVSLKHTKKRN